MLRFLQHAEVRAMGSEVSVADNKLQEELQGQDMTSRGSNAELKKIIYWITASLTSILITIGGYLYVKMEQRVSIIEVNNSLILETNKRVLTLEDWVKSHDRETFSKIEEYSKNIATLTVEVNALKKSMDNLSASQNEMLRTLKMLEISDARRNELK